MTVKNSEDDTKFENALLTFLATVNDGLQMNGLTPLTLESTILTNRSVNNRTSLFGFRTTEKISKVFGIPKHYIHYTSNQLSPSETGLRGVVYEEKVTIDTEGLALLRARIHEISALFTSHDQSEFIKTIQAFSSFVINSDRDQLAQQLYQYRLQTQSWVGENFLWAGIDNNVALTANNLGYVAPSTSYSASLQNEAFFTTSKKDWYDLCRDKEAKAKCVAWLQEFIEDEPRFKRFDFAGYKIELHFETGEARDIVIQKMHEAGFLNNATEQCAPGITGNTISLDGKLNIAKFSPIIGYENVPMPVSQSRY